MFDFRREAGQYVFVAGTDPAGGQHMSSYYAIISDKPATVRSYYRNLSRATADAAGLKGHGVVAVVRCENRAAALTPPPLAESEICWSNMSFNWLRARGYRGGK